MSGKAMEAGGRPLPTVAKSAPKRGTNGPQTGVFGNDFEAYQAAPKNLQGIVIANDFPEK